MVSAHTPELPSLMRTLNPTTGGLVTSRRFATQGSRNLRDALASLPVATAPHAG